jgi:3-(3-hydroxy-phenyl)propionate hydroxylase
MLGVAPGSILLIRPDDHVAAIAPMGPGVAEALYTAAIS